jgi:purine-nucleoside phosphorylase
MTVDELAVRAADALRERTGIAGFDVALTLGSGWKLAATHLGDTVSEVAAAEIPGFLASPVPGHTGVLRAVRLTNGAMALVIGARTHFYEGHGVDAVAHGVRTAAAAGARIMVLTNGAGGLRTSWRPGQPVLISDHLNLTGRSPLKGPHFVDLTDLYAARLRRLAREIDPDLDEGVYTQLTGPQYETPAEVRMVRALGGDIVGMSTALEAIAARQCGMDVLGISLITNLAAGIQETPLNHEEVVAAGKLAEIHAGPLLAAIVTRITEAPA